MGLIMSLSKWSFDFYLCFLDEIESTLETLGVPCSIPGTAKNCSTAGQPTNFDPLALLNSVSGYVQHITYCDQFVRVVCNVHLHNNDSHVLI